MLLDEEIITPIDDPCQFSPAWRASVANYLVGMGIRTDKDFSTLEKTGCVPVLRDAEDEAKSKEKQKPKKGKAAKKSKKKHTEEWFAENMRPIPPFYRNAKYRQYATDKWIKAYVLMKNEEFAGEPPSQSSAAMMLASRWYEEPDCYANHRHRLEPMLLTEASLDTITLDLTGRASMLPAIQAYERLYFNCREDDGTLSRSIQLLQRMATPYGPLKTFLHKWEEFDYDDGGRQYVRGDGRPLATDVDIWKALAFHMGYEPLMYLWGWEGKAHGMSHNTMEHMLGVAWKASISHALKDIFIGEVRHEDLAKLLSAYTMHTKFLSDDKRDGGGGDNDTMTALMALLSVAAPKMRVLEKGSAGMIDNNEIQSRIAAQQAIDKQHIQDAGKQVAIDVIDAQISDAVAGV